MAEEAAARQRPWRVWVVPQIREGRIPRVSWEAVAAAQRLAAALAEIDGAVRAEAVLLGTGLDGATREMAQRDLAAVHVADDPALAAYTPGAWIGVLAPAIAAASPDFVVFPHTYQTVDFVPRLAQRAGAGLLPEVTGFALPEGGAGAAGAGGLLWTRPVLGGKLQARVRVRGAGTVLVSVQSGAFSADGVAPAAAGAAEVKPLPVDAAQARPDREVLGYEEVTTQQVDLTKADVIVAVGRGVGGADKIGPVEELARALGAEIGASRPVIDSGWLPRERQIGSSGQTVAPRLYIAAGISGAIQHLVGMKASSVIVAINKDPSAPIFTVADYGLVGDLHELVPALTAAVKAAKG
ncbi:MAG TPA: electron transfer flavoprotein subunit alpha/FixB family protein [Thermoanaerobaculia bacterium]|jgi:electron transfer flavoprotein alpha subunit|nr:electron transfer flavoprotein subunit alpha/FixB family protein [Thermoanaerobaculia bacterium]